MPTGGQLGAAGFSALALRRARERAGLTPRELAERVGVSEAVIYQWQGGHRAPRVDRLGRLAQALGLSPAALIRPQPGPVSLQRLRVRAGRLQQQVADAAGMSRQKLASLEAGKPVTLADTDAVSLAAVLGVDADQVRAAYAVSRSAPSARPAPTLQDLRRRARVSQERAAEAAGMSHRLYWAVEQGEMPTLNRRAGAGLARLLGVAAATVKAAHVLSRAAFLEGLAEPRGRSTDAPAAGPLAPV